jgi:hypothetical protein
MRTFFGVILLGGFFLNLFILLMAGHLVSQGALAGYAVGMVMMLGVSCLLLLESKVSDQPADKSVSEEQNEDNICF